MSLIELPIVSTEEPARARKPEWLRVKLPIGEDYKGLDSWLMNTSCTPFARAAIAPIWENAGGWHGYLYDSGQCMHPDHVLLCSQNGRPTEYDTDEPARVAEAIRLIRVKHAVITSVNRDELKDKELKSGYQTVFW